MDAKPVSFGYKMCWLAIKNASSVELVKDLEIINPAPAGWQQGIETVYKDSQQDTMKNTVYLTPEIEGWTLIVSYSLPTPEPETAQILLELLEYLSSKYGIACSYGTNSVSEYHHWIKYTSGKLIRAFATAEGSILLDEGEVTPEESFINFDEIMKIQNPEYNGDIDFESLPDEETVLLVAENWSLNPAKLEEFSSTGEGFLGKIAEDHLNTCIPEEIAATHYPDNNSLLEQFKTFFFKK